MSSSNTFKGRQDMPPPGGYPPIGIARNMPKRLGPPGWVYFAGTFALVIGSCLSYANTQKKWNKERAEYDVFGKQREIFINAAETTRYEYMVGQRAIYRQQARDGTLDASHGGSGHH